MTRCRYSFMLVVVEHEKDQLEERAEDPKKRSNIRNDQISTIKYQNDQISYNRILLILNYNCFDMF